MAMNGYAHSHAQFLRHKMANAALWTSCLNLIVDPQHSSFPIAGAPDRGRRLGIIRLDTHTHMVVTNCTARSKSQRAKTVTCATHVAWRLPCRASPFHELVTALRRHLGDKDGNKVPHNVYVWLDIFAGATSCIGKSTRA